MKPVCIAYYSRHPSVKAEEYLFLAKSVIFRNGKVPPKIHTSRIMYVRDIL